MQSKTLGVGGIVLVLACSRAEQQEQRTPAATPAPTEAAVVEVRMTGNSRNLAAFEPAAVAIKPGTVVRFINVTGGPHNVAFWPDSIPAGSAEVLNGALVGRQGNLSSPYVVQPSATYEITFPATLPLGTYKGYCAPHLKMGMKLAITLQ